MKHLLFNIFDYLVYVRLYTVLTQLVNFMVRYAVWDGRMNCPLGCSLVAYFVVALGMTLSMRGLCY